MIIKQHSFFFSNISLFVIIQMFFNVFMKMEKQENMFEYFRQHHQVYFFSC